MPSSQLCFVYLSNYPSLIPLKDWLVGICLVFLPQSLWSDAHKHLLTARQKRWSPDPRPEGPESNEWRLHLFVFLIGKPISRSAACHCKLRARAGGNSTFFSQALVPRTPVSTEAGACLNFTSLERSCCLGQVLPLIAEPPPPPFCHPDYALHKFEYTIQTVFGAHGTLWVVQILLLFKLFYIVIHPSLLTKSYIEGQSIKEIQVELLSLKLKCGFRVPSTQFPSCPLQSSVEMLPGIHRIPQNHFRTSRLDHECYSSYSGFYNLPLWLSHKYFPSTMLNTEAGLGEWEAGMGDMVPSPRVDYITREVSRKWDEKRA